jgi:hypothetical protein
MIQRDQAYLPYQEVTLSDFSQLGLARALMAATAFAGHCIRQFYKPRRAMNVFPTPGGLQFYYFGSACSRE